MEKGGTSQRFSVLAVIGCITGCAAFTLVLLILVLSIFAGADGG